MYNIVKRVMYMKKQIIAFLLGILITLPVGTYAATKIISSRFTDNGFTVNGQPVNGEVVAILKDGEKWASTYAPIQAIAKALGGKAYIENNIVKMEVYTDLETVVKNCKDSCVMIYAYLPSGAVSQGSGWAYNGYIVTAKHVIEGATKIDIFTDDSLYGVPGTIVPIETNLDVAILKANIDLPSVTLGDSDKLIEGEKLVSITSPKGHQNAIDECVYNGPYVDASGAFVSVTESNMDNGSSGGPIFDYNNGMAAMIIEGNLEINRCIPINDIKPILITVK
jgi:S1-C subfamily serine protease